MLKEGGSAYGHRLVFLGSDGFFPSDGDNTKLRAPFSPRTGSGGSLSLRTLEDRRIGAMAIGSLIGKISFSRTCLFGNPQPMRRPLYNKGRLQHYAGKLAPRETATLTWREATLAELHHRIGGRLGRRADFSLFADAARSDPLISGFRGPSSIAQSPTSDKRATPFNAASAFPSPTQDLRVGISRAAGFSFPARRPAQKYRMRHLHGQKQCDRISPPRGFSRQLYCCRGGGLLEDYPEAGGGGMGRPRRI